MSLATPTLGFVLTATIVVSYRVGIFTEPLVAGSLGGKNRLEYGVIGDSVTIASSPERFKSSSGSMADFGNQRDRTDGAIKP